MYATDDVQALSQKIQRYSDRLRAELFRQAKRTRLIAFYNRPDNLQALWIRIEESNCWRVNDGLLVNGWEEMSVPDKDLDDEDGAYCEEHRRPVPCRYCRFEAMEQRAEELRERWRDEECDQ